MHKYEKTHPWITFDASEINRFQARPWMLLGESRSKCEHLAGAPLKPDVARHLYDVSLIKGALATTAIEGNTLTESQVQGILDGSYKAPPSREYQEREVLNVIESLQEIHGRIMDGENIQLTTALICEFNRQVLKGLELDGGAVAGEIRRHSVTVANYRGAPAEDCEYLLDRLCEWLSSDIFHSDDPEVNFALAMIKAVLAHLYLAWIHPFGDGNGRTARLVEFLLLANCGMVPMPAAHLLSNHYNLTRDQYYRELDRASKAGGEILGFITYAIQGFVDGIREAISEVRSQQMQVAWVNYVHERFGGQPNTKATDRQRALVLAMPMGGEPVPRSALTGLSPKLASLYAKAGPRTLSRDLNHLTRDMQLVRRTVRGFIARSDVVEAFLPSMAPAGASH
jgi:Fic family protein